MGGKNSREGIVEICINNLWGRVCVYGWNTRVANVTCHHAGFLDTNSKYPIYNLLLNFLFYFLLDVIHKIVYNATLSVHSAGLICQGNESSLLDCEIVSSSYCYQYTAAYVTCRG